MKTLSYASFLKVFGTLFQYLKRACDRSKCSFDTFNSKQIDKTSIAEIFGLQSRQSIYELTTINLTNPHHINWNYL